MNALTLPNAVCQRGRDNLSRFLISNRGGPEVRPAVFTYNGYRVEKVVPPELFGDEATRDNAKPIGPVDADGEEPVDQFELAIQGVGRSVALFRIHFGKTCRADTC